ncbi:MAG: M50 family metallopeptidase [Bacillota bacterium]
MKLFTFRGVDVKGDRLFILMLIFLAFVNVLPQALIMFAVVLIHELSHTLTAQHYKVAIQEVVLFPFGGVAKLDFLQVDSHEEIRIALAGPLTNFFLAGLAMAIGYYWQSDYWLPFFMRLNLVMGTFNLLPVLPLDGGRILRAWYAKRIGLYNATKKAAYYGKIVAVLLVLISVCGLYLRLWDLNAVSMAAFLFFSAGEEDRTASFHFIRYLLRKKDIILKENILNLKAVYTRDDVSINDVLPHIVPNNYHLFYVFNNKGQLLSQVSEEKLIETYFNRGGAVTMADI